jgi:2-dehydro-3-deoxyphosphogluconate aldolase/(4S)-4-hydroxy-2-oxoglutarate aldolase
MTDNWTLPAKDVLAQGPVVPVIVIKDIDHAVPLANALLEGGINVLEVTLRTPVALAAIEKIAKEVPEAMIGAGTVTNAEQMQQVTDAGCKFAISPGLTPSLLTAAKAGSIPLLPGIATISELMIGLDHGYREFKFFPAEASGGVKAIKAIGGPFPDIAFCPTGGISPANYKEYLALSNVKCVGGSWLVTDDALKTGNFAQITQLAKSAISQLNDE